MRVGKQRACFSKLGKKSIVWEMKIRDARVAVDNEDAKIEKKGYSGESKRKHRDELVWNNVGGNQMGLALMNKDLKNHKGRIDKELRKWEVVVK